MHGGVALRRNIVLIVVLTVIVVSTGFALSAGVSPWLYLAASFVFLADGFDLIVRFWLCRKARSTVPTLSVSKAPRSYAIAVAVHNLYRDFDEFESRFEAYRERVWLIDDASTDATVSRIKQAGWRVFPMSQNVKKPAAIQALLKHMPSEIETVLVTDPDVELLCDLDAVVRRFQASGMAAACPRVIVKPDGILAEFQSIEYALSFSLGRQSLSPQTVTSGVALYNRQALELVLSRHSHSVYGEDLENAVLLLADGQDIGYYPDCLMQTDAKTTLSGLFSQRVGWSFSFFKIYGERFPEIRAIAARRPFLFYQFIIYFGVMSVLLWPLKIVGLVLLTGSGLAGVSQLLGVDDAVVSWLGSPATVVSCYVQYTAIVAAGFFLTANASEQRRATRYLPLYFFYVMGMNIPMTVGYLNWIALRFFGKRVYADHYDISPKLGKN